jgi:hypothetical protein
MKQAITARCMTAIWFGAVTGMVLGQFLPWLWSPLWVVLPSFVFGQLWGVLMYISRHRNELDEGDAIIALYTHE